MKWQWATDQTADEDLGAGADQEGVWVQGGLGVPASAWKRCQKFWNQEKLTREASPGGQAYQGHADEKLQLEWFLVLK